MSKPNEEVVLERALALLEAGYCREAAARDAGGCSVDVYSPDAVEFCALAAIARALTETVGHTRVGEGGWEMVKEIADKVHPDLLGINEKLGVGPVKFLFRRRLAALNGGALFPPLLRE